MGNKTKRTSRNNKYKNNKKRKTKRKGGWSTFKKPTFKKPTFKKPTFKKPAFMTEDPKCRKYLGEKNNISPWVWLAAVFSRASYEYPQVFNQCLLNYFSMNYIDTLLGSIQNQTIIDFKNVTEKNGIKIVTNAMVEGSIGRVAETMKFESIVDNKTTNVSRGGSTGTLVEVLNKRLENKSKFPVDSAQYLSSLVNTSNTIIGENVKNIKNNTQNPVTYHTTMMGNLYTFRGSDYKSMSTLVQTSEDFKFMFIATGADMNCYIVLNVKYNIFFIVFRGTASAKSAMDDMKLWRTKISVLDNKKDYGQLHNGFLHQQENAFHRIIYCMKKMLDDNIAVNKTHLKLFVCGHSLGGANATIFSYFYSYWKDKIAKALHEESLNFKRIHLVSWGSPRVGSSTFTRDFDTRSDIHMVRAVTDGDLIPNVIPNIFGKFQHVGGEDGGKEKKAFKCNHTLKTNAQLNYTKPLQCDVRKTCEKTRGPLAHSNAAYISFAAVARTASTGHKNNNIKITYKSTQSVPTEPTLKINGYENNDLLSLNGYNMEFGNNPSIGRISHMNSGIENNKRIDDGDRFGVFMRQMKKGGNRKKTRKCRKKTRKCRKKTKRRGGSRKKRGGYVWKCPFCNVKLTFDETNPYARRKRAVTFFEQHMSGFHPEIDLKAVFKTAHEVESAALILFELKKNDEGIGKLQKLLGGLAGSIAQKAVPVVDHVAAQVSEFPEFPPIPKSGGKKRKKTRKVRRKKSKKKR